MVVQGGDPGGAQRTLSRGVGADSPRSSQVKEAERRALPGAQASPEGPAQGWGPISPRMSAAPEPSHKAKKKQHTPKEQMVSVTSVRPRMKIKNICGIQNGPAPTGQVTAGDQSQIAEA